MILLAFVLLLGGFATLCMAMDRHRRTFGLKSAPSGTQGLLRGGGAVLIGLGAVACTVAQGWSRGLTWWVALLTLAAFATMAVLTVVEVRRGR